MNEEPIRVFVLGRFEIRWGESVLHNSDWRRRKAARLIQRLALDRRLLKEQAIEFLWPESDPETGANNLYRTVYAVRQTLDRALGEGAADATFTFEAGILSLGDAVWLDADEFERLSSQAFAAPQGRRRPLLERALALYNGSLLPEARYAGWTSAWRVRLHRCHRRASLALAKLYREASEYDRAIERLTPLLSAEPADEPVHRELMRVYAYAGRRDAAIRQYERCVDALSNELDLAPGKATLNVRRQIRNGDLAPREEVAPEPGPPSGTPRASEADPAAEAPTTVPDALLGRESELQLITERLADAQCRLLTLTGPGGIGKTRLALHVASSSEGAFEDGVAVVPLNSLPTADRVVPAIAGALDLSPPAGRSRRAHLLAYLRDKRMLLVLDGFEHLIEAAPLLTDMLAHAPEVKLLVTSREQLNLRREWVIEVGGLACPEAATSAEVEACGAIRLFCYRACQRRSDFVLSDRSRSAAVRICRLVGGMPLAIEMAARWVATLPVTKIADEIEQDLDVLATTTRDVPERHRSIRALLEPSWQRLTAEEQSVLEALSVFQDGFSRAAAERVAGATLPLLSTLRAKSWLRQVSTERYAFHPLLRRFAREKLDAGDGRACDLDGDDRTYIDALQTVAARLRAGQDRRALVRLEAEIDDVWVRAGCAADTLSEPREASVGVGRARRSRLSSEN